MQTIAQGILKPRTRAYGKPCAPPVFRSTFSENTDRTGEKTDIRTARREKRTRKKGTEPAERSTVFFVLLSCHRIEKQPWRKNLFSHNNLRRRKH